MSPHQHFSVGVILSLVRPGTSLACFRGTRDANPRSDRQRAVNRSSQRITTPVRSKEHGMKIIRIVGIAGMSCLMVGPALAQSQNSPPQSPSQNPTQSQPGASTDRPVPPDPTAPNRPLSSSRGNQNVQSPRGKHMGAKHDSVRAGQAALK